MQFNYNRRTWVVASYLIASLGVALVVWRGVLQIQLGPIDDHEIVRFLGPDRTMRPWEIPGLLWHSTEVGQWGQYGRFRPIYYLMRLIEVQLFGTRATLWYLFRVLLVAGTAALIACALVFAMKPRTKLGVIALSIATIVPVVLMTSWTDIAARLGPSEIFLGVFLATFLASYVRIVEALASNRVWIVLLISAVLAVGTKENAVALLPVVVVLTIARVRKVKDSRRLTLTSASMSLIIMSLTVAGPMTWNRTNGVDIYGVSRSPSLAINQLAAYILSRNGLLQSGASVALIILSVAGGSKLFRRRKAVTALSILTLYLPITEFVFYSGRFEALRYRFVTELCVWIVTLAILFTILQFLQQLPLVNQRRQLLTAILVSATLPFYGRHFENQSKVIAEKTKRNIDITQKWNANLDVLRQQLLGTKEQWLVIQVDDIWSFEPAYSVSQYARYLAGVIPVTLNLKYQAEDDGIEADLNRKLIEIRDFGDDAWNVIPGHEFWTRDVSDYITCITFGAAAADEHLCDSTVTF